MYKYRVENITRGSICIISSDYILEVGQKVIIKFDNFGIDELCVCKVLEVLLEENIC